MQNNCIVLVFHYMHVHTSDFIEFWKLYENYRKASQIFLCSSVGVWFSTKKIMVPTVKGLFLTKLQSGHGPN